MCQCELRSGGDLNEEESPPGLNGHRLRAGPPGKIVEVNLEQGHLAERQVVVEFLPMPSYVPTGLCGARLGVLVYFAQRCKLSSIFVEQRYAG